MESEIAFGLRSWTIATLCKSLSLDNILSLIAAVLTEKQIIFFCSNIGILTSAVLSIISLIRPFNWQSLLMPVVPDNLLVLVDAPSGYAIGIQHKTPEIALKCKDKVRVNLYKDKIKNAPLPSVLPNYKQLHHDLSEWYKKMQGSKKYDRRPTHMVTPQEQYAVEGFYKILNTYLTNTMTNVERHMITDVGTDGKRISVLYQESYLESFSAHDQPFLKSFMDTQIFHAYVDSVLDNSHD